MEGIRGCVLMKRLLIGAFAAVLLFSTGALAQDYFTPLFAAFADYAVPAESPCAGVGVKQIAPYEYDKSLTLFYLCGDDRVVARRFFRPNDQSVAPTPVYIVQSPDPVPVAPPPPSNGTLSSCPGGFVEGVTGGCVPPDHPLAKIR